MDAEPMVRVVNPDAAVVTDQLLKRSALFGTHAIGFFSCGCGAACVPIHTLRSWCCANEPVSIPDALDVE